MDYMELKDSVTITLVSIFTGVAMAFVSRWSTVIEFLSELGHVLKAADSKKEGRKSSHI